MHKTGLARSGHGRKKIGKTPTGRRSGTAGETGPSLTGGPSQSDSEKHYFSYCLSNPLIETVLILYGEGAFSQLLPIEYS